MPIRPPISPVPQVLGTDRAYTVTLRKPGPAGTLVPVTTDDGVSDADALSCIITPGDNRAALATPAATWTQCDEDAAIIGVAVSAADADPTVFDDGTYILQVFLTGDSDGLVRCVFDGSITFADTAGEEDAPPSYGSHDDLLRYVPWIDDLKDALEDQAGFAQARGRAREWVDETILSRAEKTLDDQARRHAPVVLVPRIVPADGVDAGPAWGPSIYPDTTSRDQLDTLRGYLADDTLMVDSRLREIVSKKAAAIVLRSQIGPSAGDTPYQEWAKSLEMQANILMCGWVARLDTSDPPDGVADLEIR
jgi:hypothetical protein